MITKLALLFISIIFFIESNNNYALSQIGEQAVLIPQATPIPVIPTMQPDLDLQEEEETTFVNFIDKQTSEPLPGQTVEPKDIGPNFTPVNGPRIPGSNNYILCNQNNLGTTSENIDKDGPSNYVCCLNKITVTEYKGEKYIEKQDFKYGWLPGECCPAGYYISDKGFAQLENGALSSFEDSCPTCQLCVGQTCRFPHKLTDDQINNLHVNSLWPEQRQYIQTFYLNRDKEGNKLVVGCGESRTIEKGTNKGLSVDGAGEQCSYGDLVLDLYCNPNCTKEYPIIDKRFFPGCTCGDPNKRKQVESNGLKLYCE